MTGEYREESVVNQLPEEVAKMIRAGLRIGLTNRPMIGVKLREDLSEKLAIAYESIGQTKYSNGLRNGTMIPLVPLNGNGKVWDKVWSNGELFFRS